MGIFFCKNKENEDELVFVKSKDDDIQFPPYFSKADSIFDKLKENNLFKNITLIEYINLLANINTENADIPYEGPYLMNFSYEDSQKFINSNVSDELYSDFITKAILSHRTIGEKESIFRNICLEIYKILKQKIQEYYNDEEAQVTKKDLIGLGIFFCKGTNSYKMKLIYDLFKNDKGDLEQNKNFDEFLLSSFLIVSSCLMNAKKSINQINPLLSEDSLDKIDKFLEIYSLKNCEDLVQYFNLNFFNRVKLTFYEYNLNLTKANGFGWIFSPSGIRQKLEENKFLD